MQSLLGGIAIGAESTYGTAPASVTGLHARGDASSLGERRSIRKQSRLALSPPNESRDYAPSHVDGELSCGLCLTDAVVGDIMALFGNVSTLDYTIGANLAPDENSATVVVDWSGKKSQFTGCKGTSLVLNFDPGNDPSIKVGFIGQKEAASSLSYSKPAESLRLKAADYDTIDIGGTAIGHKGATLTINTPHSSAERDVVGATYIREPQRVGQTTIMFTMNVELDDATGFDSDAVLDLYRAGTDLGIITVGDGTDTHVTLTGCKMIGSPPNLGEGVVDFAIEVEAVACVITTQ